MTGTDDAAAQRIGRLAREFTSFVDRRHELREVTELLSASRLVTLTGVGGVGKTRLAMRVATRLHRAFADGVWQIQVAGLEDVSLLEYALIDAWGIRSTTNVPAARLLANYVADRELLLLLDNCERLLDGCGTLAASLLRAGPGLRVLCTSRQPLGTVGERVWEVPPLPVHSPDTPLVALQDPSHALTLFIERAAAAASDFALTASNVSTVADICWQLDGLPLAIELAAAQLRTLSLGQLAAGLVDRFRLLSARHTVPAHQRTLRDTFDWSFALCTPAEQTLWTRLAVFNGSFDLDAVAAVCADDALAPESILYVIAGLIDKSIVQRDTLVDPIRYRLLNTVREYALDRQRDAGDIRATMCRRHADWYLHVAERFDAAWFGPDQPRLCHAIRAELDNLRSALGFCLTTPGQTQTGLRLAAALRYYWIAGGGLSEGRYWLARALAADPGPTPARAAALSVNTRILTTQADHAAAEASGVECLALARRLDDPLLTTRAIQDFGMHLFMAGEDLPRARALLEDALVRYAGIDHGDDASVTLCRQTLALTMLYLGDRQHAEQLCADSRAFSQAHPDHWQRSHILVGSALVALANEDPAQAMRYLREGLPIRVELGDTVGIAQTIDIMSRTAAASGDYVRSARLAGMAHRAWHDLGRTAFGTRLFRTRVAEATEQARGGLGERAYEAAYQHGWDLSLDAGLAYALGTEPAPVPPPAQAPPADSQLTRREQEVAELIAEGLSNKQIAARLFISQRTAESHAGNILRKLGFTSRTQVANWILQRRG